MSYNLADKLQTIQAYDPIEGNYKIRLDANESYINVNDKLNDKICSSIKDICFNRYPDPIAKKVSESFAKLYNISVDNVTAGNGSDELISVISSCFLEKGDPVLTLAPDFSMYAFYGKLYELDVHVLNKNDDLEISVDEIINYCNNNNIKALIFSNPCNPTSLGINKNDIIRLIQSVSCLVILDEAYMDFWNQSIIEMTDNYDNLIILKTCSKAIGLASVRLGFAVAGKKITSMLRTVKSPYNTDSVSQAIGCTVLSEKELFKSNTEQIIANKDNLLKEMKQLAVIYPCIEKVYDSVTNFEFIKTCKANYIYTELLNKSIAVRCFDGYLRINTGSEYENTELVIALKEILKNIS